MSEKKECRGFIVHIHDPLNLDIALDIPQEYILTQYPKVTSNEYTYSDIQRTPKGELKYQIPIERNGVAYRCRIKGIASPHHQPLNRYDPMIRDAYVELSRKIDAWNGWVWCRLYDSDSFSRILIDLCDPHTKQSLAPFLLEYDRVFRPYTS